MRADLGMVVSWIVIAPFIVLVKSDLPIFELFFLVCPCRDGVPEGGRGRGADGSFRAVCLQADPPDEPGTGEEGLFCHEWQDRQQVLLRSFLRNQRGGELMPVYKTCL